MLNTQLQASTKDGTMYMASFLIKGKHRSGESYHLSSLEQNLVEEFAAIVNVQIIAAAFIPKVFLT